MAIKSPRARVTIKSLMAFVIVSGWISWASISTTKEKNEVNLMICNFNGYMNEDTKFMHLISYIANNPPKGVHGPLWRTAVYEIGKEAHAHPLREDDRERSYISELADKKASLSRINGYLRRQMEKSPIEVELLPSLRERILQDYDPEKRLTKKSGSYDHGRDCTKNFNRVMDLIRKSRPVPITGWRGGTAKGCHWICQYRIDI